MHRDSVAQPAGRNMAGFSDFSLPALLEALPCLYYICPDVRHYSLSFPIKCSVLPQYNSLSFPKNNFSVLPQQRSTKADVQTLCPSPKERAPKGPQVASSNNIRSLLYLLFTSSSRETSFVQNVV